MNVFDLVATLSLDTSGYEDGIKDAEKQGQSLGGALKSAGKTVAVAGAAVAGVGAGLFKFADSVAGNADEIDKMSQKLGLSTKAYQEWDYVMQISGTDINSMGAGIKTLTNKLDDAINGSDTAAQAFERIGLSLEDLQGMSREDVFAEVIYAFQDMDDTAERAALANELLGRSGAELAPLFNTTAEETKNLIQEVNDLGGIMSEDAVKQGAEFKDSLTSLKTAFQGAANELGQELMPYITDFIKKITEFVKEGGIKKIIDRFKQLLPVIKTVVAGFVAFKAALAISSIIKGVTTAIKGVSAAQSILNTVMSANPFGLVAAAIAAVVTVLITLWNTSEDFRNAVMAIFDAIKNYFSDLVEGVKAIFEDIPAFFEWVFESAGELVQEAWSGIVDFFSGIWDGIAGIFEGIGEWFSTIFTGAWTGIQLAWEGVTGWFQDIWDGITGIFDAAVGGVVDFFGRIFGDAWEAITDVFATVGKFFEGVFKTIKTALEGVVDFFGDLGKRAWDAFVTSNPLFEAISLGGEGFGDFITGVEMAITGKDPRVKESNEANGWGASGATERRGDINVFIGEEAVDDINVRSEQRTNLRSGGRS